MEELLDDVENYRPLKLLAECQPLKLLTLDLGVLAKRGQLDSQRMENLWSRIQRLEEVGQFGDPAEEYSADEETGIS